MNFFKRLCAAFLCSVLLALCASCSADYRDAYIYFELEQQPSTLDPQLVSTRDETVIVRCLFDTLLRYNDNGELVASACSSYEKNGLEYTFEISPDAYWTNGDKLTAHDFVFALRRAVDPETASPAAATLSAIVNAADITTGKKPTESLGVRAESDSCLAITLSFDDPDFPNTLTTPVTMPCNEKFFFECEGKYGLELDSVLACGSYYIRKWPTEGNFLIRLAKNLEYKGYFEARSMRVYFTCDEESNAEKLMDNDTDLSFVNVNGADELSGTDFILSSVGDTAYMLFISPNLDEDVRRAVMQSVKLDDGFFAEHFGSSPADSIAPDILGTATGSFASLVPYNIENAKALYSNAVLKNGKLSLNGITVKCYSDGTAAAAAKALAAHWQQQLGAFVNVEQVSSLSSLEYAYKTGGYSLLIMPVTATSRHSGSYLARFMTGEDDIASAETEFANASLCYPLFFRERYSAAAYYMKNYTATVSSGIPDIALAMKTE